MFTEEQLKQLRKVMREEIQESKKEILAKVENLSIRLEEQGEDMAGFFHKTWEVIEGNKKETEEELMTIKKHIGIASKN